MIFRVQGQPEILQAPGWQEFAARACAACGLAPGAAQFLGELSARPGFWLLLGCEDGGPKALMAAELPSPLTSHPTILLAYNVGSRALRDAVARATVSWLQAQGHTKAQMINRSGYSDAVYGRGLRPIGDVEERHTLLTVKLREEGAQGAEVVSMDGGMGAA